MNNIPRPRRRLLLTGVALVVVAVPLALAAFPWGMLRSPAERLLSSRLGRPVTIASADRVDRFGFSPTLRLSGIRVPQPAWAGTGDMVRVADLTVRFSVWPLLRGAFLPTAIDVRGLDLALVRDAAGRWNTDDDTPAAEDDATADIPRIRHLRIADSHLRVRDAKRDLTLNATLAADGTGVRLAGRGTVPGGAVTVQAQGGPLDDLDPAARYPFRLAVVAPRVALSAQGRMDHPLDTGHFTARIASRGDDFQSLDAIVQAGLPGTQDYRLTATVRRDSPDWRFTDLKGTLGRSDLAGQVAVTKRDGRTNIDATIRSDRFDFDALSPDSAQARAAAREHVTGRRILPETNIHFEKLGTLDGTLRFTARKLVMPPGSRFESLKATLVLDHRRLTVSPLVAGLTHGTLSGSVVVDHRGGDPKLRVRLAMRGARIEDVLGSVSEASGPLDGRIVLDGTGRTVRAAIGRSDGRIGLVARQGQVARTLATLAGGDLLRGARRAIGGDKGTVPIRCLIGRFRVRGGTLTPDPLLIDTSVMRADGRGRVDLSSERLDIVFTGRSKNPDILQSAAPVRVSGTMAQPKLDVTPPDPVGRRRGLFAQVGAFLKTIRTRDDAGRGARAPDADCARLERVTLR